MTTLQKITVAAMALMGTATAGQAATSELSEFKWKNRLLLIFATSSNDRELMEQRRMLLARQSGNLERDLMIIEVVAGTATVLSQSEKKLDADALRRQFQVQPGSFKVVLVGKDGGAKLEKNAPIQPRDLFSTIDAMPMRQSEIR